MHAIVGMVMDGTICKDCGNFIDGDSPGYERNCGCIVSEETNTTDLPPGKPGGFLTQRLCLMLGSMKFLATVTYLAN